MVILTAKIADNYIDRNVFSLTDGSVHVMDKNMNLTQYIPSGRTSLVKKDGAGLQIQTEYAYRPYARITTTIIHEGQVLHKIEKKLVKPIESFEEQAVMENRMNKQHQDVVAIIKENDASSLLQKSESQKIKIAKQTQETATIENNIESDIAPQASPKEFSFDDKFKAIAGVKYVYHLNIDGEFVNKIESDNFKKSFSVVFKSISELIEIFTLMPGVTFSRQCGVYEVERNKLYLVSSGDDIYFVLIEKALSAINYEKELKTIITPSYF